jgi:2-oxoglutarate ferredoxin oxidoreductase subunit gamma
MRREIRASGVGGQGLITLGKIFGKAALYDKYQVIMTEAYGPEVTGGFARADLIIDDDLIDYPIVNYPEILVVLSNEGWRRDGSLVLPTGKVLYDSALVQIEDSPAEAIEIPAFKGALELGNKVVMNVIMMGALQEITQAVTKESLEKALMSSIPKGYEELNKNALTKGYELGKNAVNKMEEIN